MVQVNRADGLGVSEIKKLGIDQIIISTEENSVISARARKLGIPFFHGIDKKKPVLINHCIKNNIDLKKVLYLGNDINDKEVMEIVGFKICPSDAYEDIKEIVDHVLKSKGGMGVIRELLDFIDK